MSQDMYAGILMGSSLVIIIVAVLQIGINLGIRACQSLIQHEYPAAHKFLFKHKGTARIIPHVIGNNND